MGYQYHVRLKTSNGHSCKQAFCLTPPPSSGGQTFFAVVTCFLYPYMYSYWCAYWYPEDRVPGRPGRGVRQACGRD